jgi:hypothetical protein
MTIFYHNDAIWTIPEKGMERAILHLRHRSGVALGMYDGMVKLWCMDSMVFACTS